MLLWFLRACWPPLLVLDLSVVGSIYLTPGFFLLTCIMTIDMVMRWKDFKKIDTFVANKGPKPLFLDLRSDTWCQRTSTTAAFEKHGYGRIAKDYYKQRGYRPWHILPDKAYRACRIIWEATSTKRTLMKASSDT